MSDSIKNMFESVIPEKIEQKGDSIKEISAVFKFVVTGDDGGVWRLNCNENLGVEAGDGDADVTYTIAGSDLIDMVEGRLNPQMAFMTQKLKIDGDMATSMKLAALFQ